MEAAVGLRELKKQMTRETIANAALRLTLERGIANVTVEEIAREAFVSARTVSNYFASKEEAVLAAGTDRVPQIIDSYCKAPLEEPPLQTLCRLLSEFARQHPDQVRHAAQMIDLEKDNPTLRPYRSARMGELQQALQACVAERTGRDAATDPYPALVASAAVAAMTVALMHWHHRRLPDEQLPRVIEDAFNVVSAGYPHEERPSPEPSGADS